MSRHYSIDEVKKHFDVSSWQSAVFSDLEAALTSKERPFPCVFGETAFKSRQLRMAFVDPLTPTTLAPILCDYLSRARDYGRMTSLVVFARPSPIRDIEYYREKLWDLLDGLERIDTVPRPEGIPACIDHPDWEFCFGGEAVFVSCATPAHMIRQSRWSSTFLNVFQPRWIFDRVMQNDNPAARRSLQMIRDRISAYDAVPIFPFLGAYGDPENREYLQYFLGETNETPSCPYHELGRVVAEEVT